MQPSTDDLQEALVLLAQSRPRTVSKAVEKAAVAVSRRQGHWGVDGEWSYDFNKLGYACAATSHSGAKPEPGKSDAGARDADDDPHSSRRDVLRGSFDRVLRSRGGATFRVLDLGSGSGGWLLQARRELEGSGRGSPTIHLHGVTGEALPSEVRAVKLSKAKKRDSVNLAHFQQVGIETFPLRLGGDTQCGSEVPRLHFARAVETARAGYDLIVSSWTFCHLIDPLATLELWSNALAVEGELYVNDIDFSVLFEGEATGTSARENDDDGRRALWEGDPEGRMERAFEVVNRKGREDDAFSIEFVYDDENYRTAVKVTRISTAPIRFAPAVAYLEDGDGERSLLDSGGRPVYRVCDKLSELDLLVAGRTT